MKLPHQPIHKVDNVVRFVPNRIVRWLLDAGPFDLNQIAKLPGITQEEHAQFAQLQAPTTSPKTTKPGVKGEHQWLK